MSSPVQPVPGLGFSYDLSDVPPVSAPAPSAPTPVAAPPASMAVPPAPAPAPAPPSIAGGVLGGSSIPIELQGKTVDEAMAIYRAMRQDHLARFQSPPAPQRDIPAAQPRPTTAAAPDPSSFWLDPESRIASIVDARLNAALAPVTQQSMHTAAQSARNAVAARFGESYAGLEGKVLEKLQNLDPGLLADPNAWANAYYLAYGEQAAVQQAMNQPPPTAPVVNGASNPATAFRPAAASMFTEPARGGTAAMVGSLSPAEMVVAQKMGMSTDSYLTWKGGKRG